MPAYGFLVRKPGPSREPHISVRTASGRPVIHRAGTCHDRLGVRHGDLNVSNTPNPTAYAQARKGIRKGMLPNGWSIRPSAPHITADGKA